MKWTLIAFLGLSLSFRAFCAPVLKVGDILLQPLACWTCSLIELEEGSIYSHMGLIISERPLLVAEAYGIVRAVPLEEFLSNTEMGQKVSVLRFKSPVVLEKLRASENELLQEFQSFRGKKYDSRFLWDNLDENGEEMYYCSEMISKLLGPFLNLEMPIKRMTFSKYREHWETYFKGNVPEGEWGNSPADFEKSPLFERVGEL